ncbi:MAG: SDR family oxidoreductase [Alphaproteobacteria bacterium]|nr:SDR family oxidoreductase [Alphaproteobacteria bacterium]
MVESQKYALITGGSRGFGASFACLLAQKGYHLILLSKQKKGLTETDDQVRKLGGNATLIPFDLRNVDLIDALAFSIAERFPHIDLLMLNAAYLGQLRPLTHITNEFWDDCISTNLTSHFRLLRGLEPLLKKAPQSDLIFVNDALAENPQPFWGPYAISKAGFLAMAHIYKAETTSVTNINTHIFTPNPMPTHLRDKAMPGEDKNALASCDEEALRLWTEMQNTTMKELKKTA